MSQIDEFDAHIEMLSKAIRQARRLFNQFKIAPRTENKKLYALITLNEIVRKCESVEAMARADAWAGIGSVTRSAYESYADLRNCVTFGNDYANYMTWMSLKQQLSMFQTVGANQDSGYFQGIEAYLKTKGQTMQQVCRETKKQMEEIAAMLPKRFKDRNGKVIGRDSFRFELAGQRKEYDALYRRLSAGAHGRISDMLDGILVNNDFQWPPGKPTEPPLVAVDCLCAMLLESCIRIARAYRKAQAPLKKLADQHAQLQRQMTW